MVIFGPINNLKPIPLIFGVTMINTLNGWSSLKNKKIVDGICHERNCIETIKVMFNLSRRSVQAGQKIYNDKFCSVFPQVFIFLWFILN